MSRLCRVVAPVWVAATTLSACSLFTDLDGISGGGGGRGAETPDGAEASVEGGAGDAGRTNDGATSDVGTDVATSVIPSRHRELGASHGPSEPVTAGSRS